MIDFILHPAVTHALVFIAGILFDTFVFRRFLFGEVTKIDLGALMRVSILAGVMMFYLGALYDSQFGDGHEPGLVFSLMGAFSFGSLVGERGFFADVLAALTRSRKDK